MTRLDVNTLRATPLWLGLAVAGMMTLSACVPLVVAGAAGVGVGVNAAEDRRSTPTQWNDRQIDHRVADRIVAKFGHATHVNVTSYDRVVLLTGEVPDEETHTELVRMTHETQDVKAVQDQVSVMPPSSVSSRGNDVTLTAKVKARMLDDKLVSVARVKVVSERGDVYLLGLVTHEEGAEAAQVASQTPGVSRVVVLFEYL